MDLINKQDYINIIFYLSDWFLRMQFFGGGRKREENSGQLGMILFIVGIVLLVLSPIIGQLIQLAVSRKREYLADASAALITRYPEGLARALEKIKSDHTPLSRANNATAHLYISNPFKDTRHAFSRLFATHPPIDDRIKKLREMA